MTQIKHVEPAPGMEALAQLVGKWHAEGELRDGPLGAAGPFVGVDTFEWLEGGRFLLHRREGRIGARSSACLEVFGKRDGELTVEGFYDDGQRRTWALALPGSSIELRGNAEGGRGDRHDLRCELRVVEEGHTLECAWSERQPGGTWRELMKTRGTKALPLPNTSVGG